MVNDFIPKKYHVESLKYVCEKIKDLEYFVFYGTILGLTREQDILENDDDVDILINSKHRDDLINIFKEGDIKIDTTIWPNNVAPYFLQARTVYEKKYLSCVDFYMYDDSLVENHIVDRWNFTGRHFEKSNYIHIPNDIIFPIREQKFNSFFVKIPNLPKKVCRFLYGNRWVLPSTKFADYITIIHNNRPQVVTLTPEIIEKYYHLMGKKP
jgi:hypothetical protein